MGQVANLRRVGNPPADVERMADNGVFISIRGGPDDYLKHS